MFKITGQLAKLQFRKVAFSNTLHNKMKVQLRQAARAWLRAVIPKVPVFLGTARGTLQPLGRFLRVAVPISPVENRRGKGPAFGAREQQFSFTARKFTYTFKWDTTLSHFIINEFFNVQASFGIPLRNPTPWGAINAGKIAFEEYVKTVVPRRIPRLTDFIKTTLLRIK